MNYMDTEYLYGDEKILYSDSTRRQRMLKARSDQSRGLSESLSGTKIRLRRDDRVDDIERFEGIFMDKEGSRYMCPHCNRPLQEDDIYYVDYLAEELLCGECLTDLYPELLEYHLDIPKYYCMSDYQKNKIKFQNEKIPEEYLVDDPTQEVYTISEKYRVIAFAQYRMEQIQDSAEISKPVLFTGYETDKRIRNAFGKACGLGEDSMTSGPDPEFRYEKVTGRGENCYPVEYGDINSTGEMLD